MKYFVFCTFLMFGFKGVFAQINDSQKTLKIDPVDSTKHMVKNLSFKISPIKGMTDKGVKYSLNLAPISFDVKKKTGGYDMSARSTLTQPDWKITQRFSEDYKDTGQFAKDFDLGDIVTTSRTIILRCRDHEYVDGDRIKLMVNNAIVHPNLSLRGDFYTIDVDLKDGFNTIHFVALNEGSSSPNTAQLQVLDPDGNLLGSNRWLILTGYKASLIVIKR